MTNELQALQAEATITLPSGAEVTVRQLKFADWQEMLERYERFLDVLATLYQGEITDQVVEEQLPYILIDIYTMAEDERRRLEEALAIAQSEAERAVAQEALDNHQNDVLTFFRLFCDVGRGAFEDAPNFLALWQAIWSRNRRPFILRLARWRATGKPKAVRAAVAEMQTEVLSFLQRSMQQDSTPETPDSPPSMPSGSRPAGPPSSDGGSSTRPSSSSPPSPAAATASRKRSSSSRAARTRESGRAPAERAAG